ncbi:proteasome assembly chaperone family protein [Halorarum salinum]|uniref:Proteasome assembly chaperone family protein n=1 Tax=Halorarum salinum TaxID=2743089 RepID=A0A7D5Q9R9_9EURY|nr:PAC2 family protein [Halobaculum salinum]QLG61857.1 proteasome assembly chaperone family protein [Halobaculum salinum]
MSQEPPSATFDRLTELEAEAPTLIEGLPGHGLVAAIATDMITRQLDLGHHGNVVSDDFPPVTSFQDGRVRELVRVYARDEPPVMTLQSDVALPGRAARALGRCILEDLAPEFDRAIFLAGSPAGTEEQVGDVFGVATTDAIESQLRGADIAPAEGSGLIGGITGALVSECYHADVPAAVLVVKANPYLPDPVAARSVIENALEPLVRFDIDTTELEEQADQIRTQMEQIARHYRQMAEAGRPELEEPTGPNMYQ